MKQKRAAYAQKYYDKYATREEEGKNMKYNNTNRPMVCMMTTSTCYQ